MAVQALESCTESLQGDHKAGEEPSSPGLQNGYHRGPCIVVQIMVIFTGFPNLGNSNLGQLPYGCFYELAVLFVGVLVSSALIPCRAVCCWLCPYYAGYLVFGGWNREAKS